MGGAFIAVADDATAASWNPGGLIQLQTPEISVVGSFIHRNEDIRFGTNPEGSGEQPISFKDLNYFSLAYPFTLYNHGMILAVNYQKLFDFNREWNFPLIAKTPYSTIDSHYDLVQSGDLSAFGLAYGIRLAPRFSFGFTLNFWKDWLNENQWEESITETISIFPDQIFSNVTEKKQYAFSGFNANVGLLWEATPQLTLGAVFKTPFTANLDIDRDILSEEMFFGEKTTQRIQLREKDRLDMPMSYGVGIAYRVSDSLTIALDINRTQWDDFIQRKADGKRISPITGDDPEISMIDPVTQVRLGFEYLFIKPQYVVPLRGGVFYDPAPAFGSPDDIFGISLGSGYARGKFVFDIAYQFRWGKDLGSSARDLQPYEFSQDLREHTIYSSLIIHY